MQLFPVMYKWIRWSQEIIIQFSCNLFCISLALRYFFVNLQSMDSMQHIILDNTLQHIGDEQYESYICHGYCYGGECTFERNNKHFKMQAGDCIIISRRGDLVENLRESADFKIDVIYVTQQFIELSTPQSNYGMRGHLALFENPIMRLTTGQQEICRMNFDYVKLRLKQVEHRFRHDALMNAIECMIIDFFDFHAQLYGVDKISSQYHQLMSEFIELLERGDYRQNREISYYANKLCVTPKYLSEVSKKVSGMPANYWITRYASLDISRLLRDRSLSLSEVSDMFGFSSMSHFTRYVQNNLGAKPSDFRS